MNDSIDQNPATPPPRPRNGAGDGATARTPATPARRHAGLCSRIAAALWLTVFLALAGTRVAQAFDPNADGFVQKVRMFPDGRILIAGTFTSIGGQPRNHYARLQADGQLDLSFHDASAAREVFAIAVQPDGKALIGGMGTQGNGGLLRLNADGSVDTGFVDAATSGQPVIRAIALQPDGKILIAGTFSVIGGQPRINLARLNADGTLDPSFDAGTQAGATQFIESLAVQADGRILASGYGTLLRLLPDGQADTAQPLPAVAAEAMVYAVALQNDGKILVGGGYGLTLGGVDRGVLIRLNADGSVDAGFLPNARGEVRSILGDDDGNLVIAGIPGSVGNVLHRGLVRLTADGNVDPTFMRPEMNASPVYDLARQADGKLILGAHFQQINGLVRNHIARLHADGRLDNGAPGPLSVTPRLGEGGSASPAAPQSVNEGAKASLTFVPDTGNVLGSVSGCGDGLRSGNVYTTGWVYADCTVSASFVPEANVVFEPAANANVESIEIQADGRILVGGWFTRIGGLDRLKMARLSQTDGAAEAGFADGTGIYQAGNTNGSVVYAVAEQPDGKILFGGEEGLIRNNADGSRDLTFSPALGPDAVVEKLLVQPDGAILAAGRQLLAGATANLVRLHADGTLDAGFSADFGEVDDIYIYAVVLEPDGRLLIGGGGTGGGYLGRLNADGSLQALLPASSTIGDVTALHRLGDGSYLVGSVVRIDFGDGSPVDSQLVRMLPNGSRDPAFVARVDGGFGGVKSIAVQPDGAILIGGGFRTVDGVVRPNLARLQANGQLDEGFIARVNTWVKDIALQADGKIVVGGYFSQVDGFPRRGLARLKADGRVDVDAFVVTPLAGANGTITPNTPQEALPGAQVQFTIVPDPGYVIGAVTGCGGSLDGLVYTTAPVGGHCAVTVEFLLETVTYTVIPAAGAHGAIVPAAPQSVLFAQTASFEVAPEAGYYLAGVEGCGGTLSGTTYTTGHILADCSVIARFHRPAALAAGAGTPQSTAVNTAFGTPLSVRVSDADGLPVSGVDVSFSAPASGVGASLSAASATTGADGLASVTARANGTVGNYVVTASAHGLQTHFALTNEAPGQGGGIELKVTVSTLPPPACGTETSLAVTPGEPVNYCFTMTNRSDVTLNHHTLTMLTQSPFQYQFYGWDRLFDRLQQPVPPGGSFRYNHVATAGTRDQAPQFTWNATASLPGYEQGSDASVAFTDIRATGTVLELDALGVHRLDALPFPISFYGQYFHEGDGSALCINNSGTLSLRTADDPDGCPISLVVPPPLVGDNEPMAAMAHTDFPYYAYNSLAAYWDLLGANGAVYYATVGEAPNRRLIVQWSDKDHASYPNPAGGVTFQAVLEEGTGRIHYVYQDLTFDVVAEPNPDFGGSATVGLLGFTPMSENPPYLEYAYNSPILAEGQVITWTPVDVPRQAWSDVHVEVGAPRLALAPASIQARTGAGEQTRASLSIGNTGEIGLIWSLQEAQAQAHFPPVDLTAWLPDLARSSESAWRPASTRPAKGGSNNAPDSMFEVPAYANARTHWNGFNLGAISFDASRPDLVVPGAGVPMQSGDYIVAEFAGNDFSRVYAIGSFGGDRGFSWSDTTTLMPTAIGELIPRNPDQPPYMRWTGMAWDSRTDTMFATTASDLDGCTSAVASDLYRIDLATAQADFVGAIDAGTSVCIRALAVGPDGAMYGIDDFNNALVAIDKTTGAAAVVGPLGVAVEGTDFSADFDDSTGVLYFANGSRLYTLNLVTGAATLLGPGLSIDGGPVRIDGLGIVVPGGDCAAPSQVPWLRVQQTAGTTPPDAQAQVAVDFDARDLAPGTYEADLCVFSNDRAQSLVRVPVSLTVTEGGGDAIFADGFEAAP